MKLSEEFRKVIIVEKQYIAIVMKDYVTRGCYKEELNVKTAN